MPPAVVAIGAAIATAAIQHFVANAIVAAVLTLAVNIGASVLINASRKSKPGVAGQELRMKLDPMAPRQIPLGRAATAGSLVWAYTYGQAGDIPNAFLTRIIAISDLPVQGIVKVLEGTQQLTFNGDIHTGWRECLQHRSKKGQARMWMRAYRGDPNAVADQTLRQTAPGWSVNHRGRNMAYVAVRYQYDDDAFSSGEPRLVFVVDGVSVYDDRDGSQSLDNPSSWKFSENAAVLAAQVMRGFRNNGQLIFGVGAEERDLAKTMLISAYNTCDQMVGAEEGSVPRYRAGVMYSSVETHAAILGDLMAAMDGRIIDRGGAITILPGATRTPIFSITDDDLVAGESKSWQPRAAVSDLVNYITSSFTDEGQNYQETSLPIMQNPQWELDDGGQRFTQNYSFRAITNKSQAQRIVKRIHASTRLQGQAVFVLPIWALELEQGDWFEWTSARFGFTNKLFEAITVDITRDLKVVVVAKETSASIDGWDHSVDERPRTDQIWNPVVIPLPVPTVSLSPITIRNDATRFEDTGIRVNLNIPGGVDDSAGWLSGMELQYARSSETGAPITRGNLPAFNQRHDVMGLEPFTQYSARARTTDGFRWSDWSEWATIFTDTRIYDLTGAGAWTPALNSIIRQGGTYSTAQSGWFTSQEPFAQALISFSRPVNNQTALIGLNSNTAYPQGSNIRYGIYFGQGAWVALHLGVAVGEARSFSPGDQFTIAHRADQVIIAQNGNVMHIFNGVPRGARHYLGAVIAEPGVGFNNLVFVPGSEPGIYSDIRFTRSPTVPATPQGNEPPGWSESIPSGNDPVWASQAQKTASGTLIGSWSTPARISGQISPVPYSNSATYYQYQTVTFNGGTYMLAVASSTGNPPSGTAQANNWWDVIAAPGAPGTPAVPPGGSNMTIDIGGGDGLVNLRSLADQAGYAGGNSNIVFNITGSRRGSPGQPAIDTGTWPAGFTHSITINVQPGVTLAGGGGNGGWAPYGVGEAGGDAIFCQVNCTINNSGHIIGGGGGGGAGRNVRVNQGGTGWWEYEDPVFYGGGGGGGGWPNGLGGWGSDVEFYPGQPGGNGSWSAPGEGGLGAYPSINGGRGGGWGENGFAGGGPGGAGGAAGYAVRKNGFTVSNPNGTYNGFWS